MKKRVLSGVVIFFILICTTSVIKVHAQEERYDLLWNYKTEELVRSVSISSDSSYVAAGSYDDNIYFFDSKGTLLWNYKTDNNVYSVSVSSDGSYIAAGSRDNNVYFFNREGTLLWKYKTNDDVSSVSVSSDGSYIAVVSSDGNIYFFSRGGKRLWTYRGSYYGWESGVSVSSDGSYIVVGSSNIDFFNREGNILWNYATSSYVVSVSASSDSSYIAAGSSNGNIYFFNREGKLLWSYKSSDTVYSISVSSDGSYIAGSNDNNVNFFDRDGHLLWSYEINSFVAGVSVSSNGSYVVTGSEDGNVYLFQNVEILAKDAITEAKEEISKVKPEYLDIAEAESLLSKAEQAYSSGDYTSAKSLAERVDAKVKEIVQIENSAKISLDNTKPVIPQEKARGFNVAEAESLLSKAEQAYSSGDYVSAKSWADSAKVIAIDVDSDGVSNSDDIAPTIHNNYIYGSALLTLFSLIIGMKLYLKFKASRKEKLRQEARSILSSFSGGQSDYKSGALYSEAKIAFNKNNYSKVKKLINDAKKHYNIEIEILKDIELIRNQMPQSCEKYFKETDLIVNKILKALKEGKSKDVGKLVSDAKYVLKDELKIAEYEKEKDDLINEMDDSLK